MDFSFPSLSPSQCHWISPLEDDVDGVVVGELAGPEEGRLLLLLPDDAVTLLQRVVLEMGHRSQQPRPEKYIDKSRYTRYSLWGTVDKG